MLKITSKNAFYKIFFVSIEHLKCSKHFANLYRTPDDCNSNSAKITECQKIVPLACQWKILEFFDFELIQWL